MTGPQRLAPRRQAVGRMTTAPRALERRQPVVGRLLARLRPAFGATGLVGAFAVGWALALGAAAERSPLLPADFERPPPRSFRGPLAGWADELGLALSLEAVAVLVLAASGCYLLALWGAREFRAPVVIGALVALHVGFALCPPVISADVFGYLAYGRLEVLHGLSPYTHAPAAVPGDPLLAYVGLQGHPSPYGPLFTLGSYAVAPLGSVAGLWTMKAVHAASALACLAFVWVCARRLGREPLPVLVFVGLNPLWLVWAVGGAHNDLLMMAVAMGAAALLTRGRSTSGAALGAVAVGVKPTAVLFLPFMVLGARRPRAALGGSLAALAAALAVSLAFFGAELVDFGAVALAHASYVSRFSVPTGVAEALGIGGLSKGIRVALTAVGLSAVLLALRSAHRGTQWITAAGWATLAVLLTTTWLYPWYVVWVLPLAALSSSRGLCGAALGVTGLVIAVRLPLALTSPL